MIAAAGNSWSQPRGDGMSLTYVVGIDGSEHSRRATEWTVGQAAVSPRPPEPRDLLL
jgi:hypothetical protein